MTTDSDRQSLLRIRDVRQRTGLSNSVLYRLMQHGTFPAPVKLGPRASAWVENEVASWIQTRIAARDAINTTTQ